MKNWILISLLATNLTFAQDEVPKLKDWKEYSSLLAKKYSINYQQLPKSGTISKKPWAGNRWDSSKGGANFRWHGKNNSHTSYKYILAMDAAPRTNWIKGVSPTEKFDILGADSLWTLTAGEKKRTKTPGALKSLKQWSAIAGLNFINPNPVNITNKDGISVPFGESDIKALLALGMLQSEPHKRIYMAGICNNKVKKLFNQYFRKSINKAQLNQKLTALKCNQMNAASFHVAITNLLGKRGEDLIIEFQDNDANESGRIVYAYKVISQKDLMPPPAPGDIAPRKKKLAITVQLDLIGDAKHSWNNSSVGSAIIRKNISYTLHINENGEIFGGSWAGGAFPKLLWKVSNINLKKGPPGLDFIYNASIGKGSKTKRYSGADLKKIFKRSARKAFIRTAFVKGLKEMAEQTRKEREAYERKVKEETIDKFWVERERRLKRFKQIHASLKPSIEKARGQIRMKDYVNKEFYSAMYRRRSRIKKNILAGMESNVVMARSEVRRKTALKNQAIFEFKDRLKVKRDLAINRISIEIGKHLDKIRVDIEAKRQLSHKEQVKLANLLDNIDVLGQNRFRCNMIAYTPKTDDGISFVKYFYGDSNDVRSVCEKVEDSCNSWMNRTFSEKVSSCFYSSPKKVLKGCRFEQRTKVRKRLKGVFLAAGVTEEQACKIAEFNCIEDKNILQKCVKGKLQRGDNFLEMLPSSRI